MGLLLYAAMEYELDDRALAHSGGSSRGMQLTTEAEAMAMARAGRNDR